MELRKEYLNAVARNTQSYAYSGWRTEQFDVWNVFLRQHTLELQTFENSPVFWLTLY